MGNILENTDAKSYVHYIKSLLVPYSKPERRHAFRKLNYFCVALPQL